MKTFTVSLTFECIDANNPLEAAKKALQWIKNGADNMIYDVLDEDNEDKFTVDLSESDEDAVLINND